MNKHSALTLLAPSNLMLSSGKPIERMAIADDGTAMFCSLLEASDR